MINIKNLPNPSVKFPMPFFTKEHGDFYFVINRFSAAEAELWQNFKKHGHKAKNFGLWLCMSYCNIAAVDRTGYFFNSAKGLKKESFPEFNDKLNILPILWVNKIYTCAVQVNPELDWKNLFIKSNTKWSVINAV